MCVFSHDEQVENVGLGHAWKGFNAGEDLKITFFERYRKIYFNFK